jgi:hypothetical protein
MPITYKGGCCAGCTDPGAALGAIGGHRGRALRQLGRAHQAGALAGLGDIGDIDMSSFVVSESGLDQETVAFDGRLNAWLLDYAAAAATLPASFVAQVDAFVAAWRAQKDQFYWFQTSRLGDIVRSEGDFNRLRAQFLTYGQTTAVGPATVTADGQTVPTDQIPAGADWVSKLESSLKWAGLLVGGVALLKITSDLGVWKRLGRVAGGPA